ncbi:glycosyltransferase family 2 protein [Actinomadura rayongensis]|uniref:Glycosyltransferase n=1 Tax=Actinomadura rayongensis TaxID=1429076 RepID=A0A6I4W612_9ACTN|nr:glycosyltransferase family 2 protein [Actinomadura rayongensis]MXQ64200.1 glycosyltransferase [Actinomadura rayongensis]
MTVVIITRNRCGELLHVLGRMTSVPERPPIIVMDNGSTDGTASAVADAFPQVEVTALRDNLGAVARNLAVERVTTPYVAFCDDDTWWEPGSLARAADHLDAHPSVASVTALIRVEPDGAEDPITPELRHSPVPGPDSLPGPALLGILAGASMLRVSAFREAGGFSERLGFGGEEELLSLDLAAADWWLCFTEDVVVHHAASTVRDPRSRRRRGIRNTLWTTWLRRPGLDAVRRTGTLLRSVPRDTASAAAVAEAVRGLPWVLRERRPVPARVAFGLRLLEDAQRRSPARRYVG